MTRRGVGRVREGVIVVEIEPMSETLFEVYHRLATKSTIG